MNAGNLKDVFSFICDRSSVLNGVLLTPGRVQADLTSVPLIVHSKPIYLNIFITSHYLLPRELCSSRTF